MFKAMTASSRYSTSSVFKIPHLQSTCRRLHGVGEVARSTNGVEAVPQVASKKSRRPILPPEKVLKSRRQGHEGSVSANPEHPDSPRKWTKREQLVKTHKKFQKPLVSQRTIRPAVQSARVKEICEKSGVEEAVSFVLTAPMDTLDTIVWNTLMSALTRIGRRKRAYEVYIEMKRRGFTPNARTFRTLLGGMADIAAPDWPSNSDNLQRCHNLYEALEAYTKTCKTENLVAEFPYLSHARGYYIRILARTGNYQKIVDIFYNADETGPFSRDKYLYTALFKSLLTRTETEQNSKLSVSEQNASDAKFYWRTLEKDMERGEKIDSYVISPFIKVLAGGRAADQQLGLSLIRDYFGLAPPGEDVPPPRIPLDSYAFHSILELCNKARKFRQCTYFMKHITEQLHKDPKTLPKVSIDHRHINEQLIALGQLSAVGTFDESEKAVDAIRYLRRKTALDAESKDANQAVNNVPLLHPQAVTLALGVCWRSVDWDRATEIFSLATDAPAEDFLDDGPIASRSTTHDRPTLPRGLVLYTSAFTQLARTAQSSGDPPRIRQCLRMIWAYGHDAKPNDTHHNFYKIRLAETTIKLVDAVQADWPKDEVKVWKDMKRDSYAILSKRVTIERPEEEDGGLGSKEYIGKLQQAIDFELFSRSS